MTAVELLTIGHGTLSADRLADLLQGAGVDVLVDVRSYPGSRRHPHFGREQMELWVPAADVDYRWERRLGGRRATHPDTVNVALRHPAFRGYADYMASAEFASALDDLVRLADARRTAVMCSESMWWRCHRRLLSDAAVLVRGVDVRHVMHDGRRVPHPLTAGVRLDDDHVVYDVGGDMPLPL